MLPLSPVTAVSRNGLNLSPASRVFPFLDQPSTKRLGKRGEGQWTRISWEEALDTIAEKVRETIARDGQKAIALAQGTPKGLELFLMLRLANLLNIPNVSTPGHICHMPREAASAKAGRAGTDTGTVNV